MGWWRVGWVLLIAWSIFTPNVFAQDQVPSKQSSGPAQFWAEFRTAVQSENVDRLTRLTSFPFKTRGPLDSDPVIFHSKDSFGQIVGKLFAQDPGLREQPETMKDLILRTMVLDSKQVDQASATFRVGNFVFKRVGGRWSFVMAYVEE